MQPVNRTPPLGIMMAPPAEEAPAIGKNATDKTAEEQVLPSTGQLQDLDKRLTRGYLAKLFEALGSFPVDGLLEEPLEKVIELLIYQAGILLLNFKENQNTAFIVQWMEVLKNKN